MENLIKPLQRSVVFTTFALIVSLFLGVDKPIVLLIVVMDFFFALGLAMATGFTIFKKE